MKKSRSLFEIQTAFQEAIMNRSFSSLLAEEIVEKAPISNERRLEIYQDAYEIRMVESLSEDFPNVEKEIKSDVFEKLALEFLKKHPSRYRNLSEVSQNFPEFLKDKSKLLHEIAVQDWLQILSAYALEPLEETVASAEEIQNGMEFLIKKHPASLTLKVEQKIFLGYRHAWETNVVEISEKEMFLLSFIESARTLEEFSKFSLDLGFTETELGNLLSQWMKNEIVFCERKAL
ncbi:MAG: HvfC/BufC N-terminal domain-containing protein [Bdellovibrio sp.]